MNINLFLETEYIGSNKKLCPGCNQYKNRVGDFPSRGRNKNGAQLYRWVCKQCYKPIRKKKPSTKENPKRRVENRRKFIINYLNNHPCVDCGVTDIRVLEFDHIGTEKNKNVTDLVLRGKAIERIEKEISLCEVVCANCHRIRTMKRGNHYRHTYMQQIKNGE